MIGGNGMALTTEVDPYISRNECERTGRSHAGERDSDGEV